MILAAGFGTRLRPLTLKTPKPLLPVANRPLLEYTLDLLGTAGAEEVIVNAHHLADVMDEGLKRIAGGPRIHLSREPEILGTAGGPKLASPLLTAEGTFLLLNGDFLIDVDPAEAIDFHRRRGARATMVLREDSGGGIYIDRQGRIRQFLEPKSRPAPEWVRCGFTGIHVLEPEVMDLIPPHLPWEINRQVYPEMLKRGWPVFGLLHSGYWREAGDPAGFLAAGIEIVSGAAGALGPRHGAGRLNPEGQGFRPPVLVDERAVVGDGAVLGPGTVIGPGAVIGAGATVEEAVVLAGGSVGAGESVRRKIVFPGGRIEAPPRPAIA